MVDPRLIQFVNVQCVQFPTARMPLIEFTRAFRESLPARFQDDWPHGRIVAELAEAGFRCGIDQKTYHVAGLALKGTWQIDARGRMVLQAAITRAKAVASKEAARR
jgi:hypothetical protein